ncbi:hypothetical protein DCAR_0625804 [Daucus carota subsp. sativus]|uniref:Uncharacterized protein n=1 Tax=Daucus carota subsp. sativus TaxID=79200 RepID=A0A161YGC6_DAUCS|nr:hypothetical protein DCAR_0625804 [Daucus carota subsp. sativus]
MSDDRNDHGMSGNLRKQQNRVAPHYLQPWCPDLQICTALIPPPFLSFLFH